jgi:hypothetical protein
VLLGVFLEVHAISATMDTDQSPEKVELRFVSHAPIPTPDSSIASMLALLLERSIPTEEMTVNTLLPTNKRDNNLTQIPPNPLTLAPTQT